MLVRVLSPAEAILHIPALSSILIDCVEGGASVSFMAPMTRAKADAFWRGVAEGVAAGHRILLLAELDGEPVGTAQVVTDLPENQPHRADVAKVLVREAARRQGIGHALMLAAEREALAAGRTLLVLDTAAGEAGRLYARTGWTAVGSIPGYALMPDGAPCATTIFYKRLSPDAAS